MNAQSTHLQADVGELAQQVTASTPIARFVPTAAAVPDQTVDRWVEQELQHGHRSVRAGITMLAILVAATIPLVLFVK